MTLTADCVDGGIMCCCLTSFSLVTFSHGFCRSWWVCWSNRSSSIRLSVFVQLNSALETNVLHHSSSMIEAEGQLLLHTAQVGWDHFCALINDIIIYLLVLSLSNMNICVIKTVRNDWVKRLFHTTVCDRRPWESSHICNETCDQHEYTSVTWLTAVHAVAKGWVCTISLYSVLTLSLTASCCFMRAELNFLAVGETRRILVQEAQMVHFVSFYTQSD